MTKIDDFVREVSLRLDDIVFTYTPNTNTVKLCSEKERDYVPIPPVSMPWPLPGSKRHYPRDISKKSLKIILEHAQKLGLYVAVRGTILVGCNKEMAV